MGQRMSFLHMLYQLIISPLELLIETVYVFSYEIIGDYGLAIIPLSLSVNFFLLPLYNRAEAIQEEERNRERNMSAGVEHIKKTFKGDERYMMLKAYYRINSYKPIYSLRSTLPLVLEVPFFIAAYHFLSNLTLLKYSGFGPINDLSIPDSLVSVEGISINVLPIIMTIINIVSSRIYSGTLSIKEKSRLYGMAIFFLILLYSSPSGLVLYWTLNNLFSLLKNIVNRSKDKDHLVRFLMTLLAIGIWGLGIFYSLIVIKIDYHVAILILLGGIAFSPMIKYLMNRLGHKTYRNNMSVVDDKCVSKIFLFASLFMAVLTGALIPSSVIVSSPAEFIIINDYLPTVYYVVNSFLCAIGLYVVWFRVFFSLLNNYLKRIICIGFIVLSYDSLINYMFFGTRLGNLTDHLVYEKGLNFSAFELLLNTIILCGITLLFVFMFKKTKKLLLFIYPVVICSLSLMSAINIFRIVQETPDIENVIQDDVNLVAENRASLTLSKTEKNVIVIMLDRAINGYVPYIFNERPELIDQFDGFTYYPNTISYGGFTNTGSPALFGGYEYTPEEMNARDGISLCEKHNEALRLMPYIFDDHGFDVTVLDPPYANYSFLTDLSIYDEHENIKAFNTINGEFSDFRYDAGMNDENINETKKEIWNRNLFCFGIMKTSPLVLQDMLYNKGDYYSILRFADEIYTRQRVTSRSEAIGVSQTFANSYAALCALSYMTEFTESEQGSFLMIQNDTTHNETLLQEPEYKPVTYVDNNLYDEENESRFDINGRILRTDTPEQMSHYHVNVAALMAIGEWLDYLRENDAYDNTRIIIVADHGRSLAQFDDMILGNEYEVNGYNPEDIMLYNPLLMVKDFDSKGFETDYSFMTNADTPTLAFSGVVDKPVNPFTGMLITSDAKSAPEQHIFSSDEWFIALNNGTTFKPGLWYSVKNGNIFDQKNWKKIGEY